MHLEIQHIEIHVSSMEMARAFYIDQLGLELLEETPAINLMSLKAGAVRISIFGGYEAIANPIEQKAGTHIIFRTDNIELTYAELKSRGVEFKGEIFEAPGFLMGATTFDPDGNMIEIAQYLRDPLKRQGK